MGAAAGKIGQWFLEYRQLLSRISGLLVIFLGLFLLGIVKFKSLYTTRRFGFRRLGPFTAPVTGMAFAFGWTPCIGPFLGSILTLAAAGGSSAQGIFYLSLYSLGLAIPFLLSALLLASLLGAFNWVKRHFTVINIVSGSLLILMGIVLLTGRLSEISYTLTGSLESLDTSTIFGGASVGAVTSFVAGLLSFLSPCVLPLVPGYLSFISGIAVEDLMRQEG